MMCELCNIEMDKEIDCYHCGYCGDVINFDNNVDNPSNLVVVYDYEG